MVDNTRVGPQRPSVLRAGSLVGAWLECSLRRRPLERRDKPQLQTAAAVAVVVVVHGLTGAVSAADVCGAQACYLGAHGW
jgi:hypothetical protein